MTIPVEDSLGEIERTEEGVTLRFERTYPRPRAQVWRALTDPVQIAVWLDKATVELRIGGPFEVQFDDGTMNGRITELDRERVLAYSWHEGQFGESHVRWELSDRPGGGTQLRLTHVKLRNESAAGFAAGWHQHLERMDALLEGSSTAWSPERFDELLSTYTGVART